MSDHSDADWINLKDALIWVLTRDSNALADKFTGSSSVRHRLLPIHWKRGWRELRPAIVKRKVRARGQSFNQATPPRTMAARSIGLDPRRMRLAIEVDQVATLELDAVTFDLKPGGWALVGGQGWKYVEIAKADLATTFREGDSTPLFVGSISAKPSRVLARATQGEKPAGLGDPSKNAPTKAPAAPKPEHPIIETWRSIYPDGPPPGTKIKTQDHKISERMKVQTGSGRDRSTIRRVFKEAGIKRPR